MCGNDSEFCGSSSSAMGTAGVDGFGVDFFNTSFQKLYQRNNKSGGLKNMRCFPSCAAAHRERGFCGRSVQVQVTAPIDNVVVYAQFVPETALDNPMARGHINPSIDEVVNMSELKVLERSYSNLVKPYILATAVADREKVFEFNSRLKGWAYSQVQSKHNCNSKHVFKVYVFETIGEDQLRLKATCHSTPFTIFCRRRKRFTIKPTAPVANPQRKKIKAEPQSPLASSQAPEGFRAPTKSNSKSANKRAANRVKRTVVECEAPAKKIKIEPQTSLMSEVVIDPLPLDLQDEFETVSLMSDETFDFTDLFDEDSEALNGDLKFDGRDLDFDDLLTVF